MNLNIVFFAVFLFILIFCKLYKPSLLFIIWPIICFIFRTARTMFGSAPIYWDDVCFVFVLSVFPLNIYFQKWLKSIPPWHLYLVLVSFLFGCLSAVIYFGPAPEIFYILLHKGICWFAFPFGILIFHPDIKPVYQKNLVWGFIIIAFTYCAWSAVESGSPSRALLLNNIFFKDMGEDIRITRESLGEYYADRPNGAFMAGTAFGGASTIVAYTCWFLSTLFVNDYKKLILATIAALIAMLFTVSRLDIIAVALSYIIFLLLSRSKSKVIYVALGFVAINIILILSNSFVISTIFGRFSRWSGGVSTDQSFTARSVDGPRRLLNFIESHPYTLLTGVGMEVEKLAKKNIKVGGFDSGFISNGFFLFMYYTGLIGFFVYVSFWIWMCYKAIRALPIFKAHSFAIVVGIIFMIFGDNYGVEDETIIKAIFLLAGLLIGSNYFERLKNRKAYNNEL